MCTYNGQEYLEEQLDSLFGNTVQDWDIYISDDGSKDRTLDILMQYFEKYPNRMHLRVNETNKGASNNFLSMAQELGKEMQEDDFIMFADQDDLWYENKIKITLEYMNKLINELGNQVPLLVCSDVRVIDENQNIISDSFLRMNHYNVKRLDFSHLIMENKVQGCTTMINKVLAMQLETLPQYATMYDMWLGLIAAVQGKIIYIEQPTMDYRQHSNNVKGSRDFWYDVISKFSNLGQQRQMIFDTTAQISELIFLYSEKMMEKDLRIAEAFSTLERQNWVMRRINIIKYHMWKSGIIRNLGMLILI